MKWMTKYMCGVPAGRVHHDCASQQVWQYSTLPATGSQDSAFRHTKGAVCTNEQGGSWRYKMKQTARREECHNLYCELCRADITTTGRPQQSDVHLTDPWRQRS